MLTFLSIASIATTMGVLAGTTLRAIEHDSTYVVVYNTIAAKNADPAPEPTFGDSVVFNNPIFDVTNSKKIGHTSGICYFLVDKTAECTWTNYSLLQPALSAGQNVKNA